MLDTFIVTYYMFHSNKEKLLNTCFVQPLRREFFRIH